MAFLSANMISVAVASALLYVIYAVCKGIYNIYFGPLSHIPGPKFPIATSWYECYHDVWRRGLYYQKVKQFHERYGPIVRISPHEVHIDDPSYFDELYNNNHKWEKYEPYMAQFNSPGATISTAHYDLHRMRRRPLNNFFSKRSIVALEPLIYRSVDALSKRLGEHRSSGVPLTVNHAMLCFTGDVVSEYVFGESWQLLEAPDFAPWMLSANKRAGELSHSMKQWPWAVHLLDRLPAPLLATLAPDVAKIFRFQEKAREHIDRIRASDKRENTIVGALLAADLPAYEKSTVRLTKEGFTLVAAGGDTTGSTISLLVYHLWANAGTLERLRAALRPAFAAGRPTWTQLEAVPYMAAVVREGLRLNVGVTSRVPRVAPDRDTRYAGFVIPRGTPVGMSIPDLHENPHLFPDPRAFRPERWLADGGTLDVALDRWLVPFVKGNRQCLGMNLAYAEIYLCVAALAMRFDFDLYHTTRRDVDWLHDFTVPQPALDSKLIRVVVK